MFQQLATLARQGMACRMASREFAGALLEGETDPEMATYLENSIKAIDRHTARDREWVEMKDPKAEFRDEPDGPDLRKEGENRQSDIVRRLLSDPVLRAAG